MNSIAQTQLPEPASAANAPKTEGGIDPQTLLDQPELEVRLKTLLERSRREEVRATLALLQLKNFYEIRTWVGKAEASLLLADITLVLCRALPPTVTLSRCENYEFALLLSNECSSNAREITRRVQSAMQSAMSSTIPPQLQLHCGVGLARIGTGVVSVDVLFARARHSLSHSGTSEGAGNLDGLDGETLVRCIPNALRKRQLNLNFQALLRFKHLQQPWYEVRSTLRLDGTTIPGQQLYESAVWNALGEALDRTVLHQCCLLLRAGDQEHTRLIVNLSLNSLVSSKFMPWLTELLARFPDLNGRLLLQISELDLLVAQHHLSTFSDALRALKVPLCITHFGCTRDALRYPLRYLHLLYIHMVKLDTALVAKLKTESLQLEAMQKLIASLHDKGIRVAAGMIDRPALLPLLWQVGIDAVQGNSIQACLAQPESPTVEQCQPDDEKNCTN